MKVHLGLLLILLLINLIPEKRINRRKVMLPLSFLLILAYWALRYDYGLDYWNYYNSFMIDQEGKSYGFGERWFYAFMYFFDYYYQVIIVESIIIVASLYRLVWHYVPVRYYWLFFFLLFCIPGFHFNLISAQRSTMAACILYWAFDLFYITKKKWLPYIAFVFFASMFHTSALTFLLLPAIHYATNLLNGKTIFVVLIVLNIISMFYVKELFDWVISRSELTEEYRYYSDIMGNRNFFGILSKSVILIPVYYICIWYDKIKYDIVFRNVCVLSFFGLAIHMVGINFQGRFTVYLYPYVIVAIATTLQHVDKKDRWIMLCPYLLSVVYFLVLYYQSLIANITGRWAEGNPYFYHTIFDAPTFPF